MVGVTGLIESTFCLDRALHSLLNRRKFYMNLKGLIIKAALKSKNTTQMIIEVNLFIRDRNYLFYLLFQRYMT